MRFIDETNENFMMILIGLLRNGRNTYENLAHSYLEINLIHTNSNSEQYQASKNITIISKYWKWLKLKINYKSINLSL